MTRIYLILVALITLAGNPIHAQIGEVCNWDSGKQAAVVLTFDDWSPGHYPIVVPELKARGMVGTFYPIISKLDSESKNWDNLQTTVSYGNEIGNHTNTHPGLPEQSGEIISTEVRGNQKHINQKIATQKVLTFAYPYGAYSQQVIDSVRNSGHIAARGVVPAQSYPYHFASADKDYYELNCFCMDSNTTSASYQNEVNKLIDGGGLLTILYHSVDDAAGTYNDNWYAKVELDSLKKQLDILAASENKLWITTLTDAIKYHREANCASIKEVKAFDGKKWVVSLTDTLTNNDLYNLPLTVKLKANGVAYFKVQQNGKEIAIDSVYNDTIVFKAIPDAGDIVLEGVKRNKITADNKNIEYTGRIDFSDVLAPKFSFSGVSIRANFTGTTIAAILNDDTGDNYFNVIIDGKVTSVIHVTKGQKIYELGNGLEDTNHEIELFKRTELTFGKTQFFGFLVEDGHDLKPIENERALFFEFIGNSITCGYGNEGLNGDDFLATTENHYMTYAAVTSRSFNARHMAVSRSGIGVYRNYDGPVTGSDDCMTNLYKHTFLYDAYPEYDFAKQPDLVCINLGTNDFSTSGANTTLYIKNYLRLIDSIQTQYNKPEIVCLLGPMLSGESLIQVRNCLKYIAETANAKGKGSVHFFEMSAQNGDLGIGVHYHPTVAQHVKDANELCNYLRDLKGWKVTPFMVSATVSSPTSIKVKFNTQVQAAKGRLKGFSVADNKIESIAIDASDATVVNIVLKEAVEASQKTVISYKKGNLVSADAVPLKTVSEYTVDDQL